MHIFTNPPAILLPGSPPPPSSSFHAPNLTQVGPVRDGAADRVDRVAADKQVEISAGRAERVVAGRANLRGSLPPAMLPADDVWLQRVVQPGAGAHTALRRLEAHPVAWADAALRRRCRVQLHLWFHRLPAQAGQVAVLGFTK